jgi:glycosyltransferase involved in cell wall biosynthesis
MPAVSVIVPVYNSARFLSEAIESVLRQTYTDWELLLVDDGSTDASAELAAAHAAKYPGRVQVLFHPGRENRGVSATRNRAIEHASGQYLAFLDADDVWLPHRLASQVPILEQYPEVGLVYGLSLCVDEHTQKLTKPTGPFRYLGEYGVGIAGPPFDAYAGFLVGSLFAPVSTVLARVGIVRKCGGFTLGLRHQIEDQVLWTKMARKASFFFVNELLALYRVHASSWSGAQDALTRLDAQLEHLIRLASDEPEIDPMLADGLAYYVKLYWIREGVPLHARIERSKEILGFLRSRGKLGDVLLRFMKRRGKQALDKLLAPARRRRRGTPA